MASGVLLIACGALAKELVALQRQNQWTHIKIQCLPAELHNRPEKIPARIRETIEKYRGEYQHIFVAYADCGTGGMLDAVLAEYDIERLPGAHCYEFFAGSDVFASLSEQEPGTYYLTDFLVRHFDRLVKKGLGLDKHPELMPAYFGNYRKLVYLAQTDSEQLTKQAEAQAAYLGLEYEKVVTGLKPVGHEISEHIVQWQN
jgi:hypothetical protein